jgi:sterol desaturase/sphingolipid hydroxylase (fatty acid hydroxylase superfamily)
LQLVLNGPEMHRLHHSAGAEQSMNLASKIALWDFLFGTARRTRERPSAYGLRGGARYPEGFFAQCAYAFRRFAQNGRG